uniref:poly(A)-specific ribonuclease n=1 Tax=Panagrellus redivivus TaxID=6233 RepID=A0A7E4VH53_PANRE
MSLRNASRPQTPQRSRSPVAGCTLFPAVAPAVSSALSVLACSVFVYCLSLSDVFSRNVLRSSIANPNFHRVYFNRPLAGLNESISRTVLPRMHHTQSNPVFHVDPRAYVPLPRNIHPQRPPMHQTGYTIGPPPAFTFPPPALATIHPAPVDPPPVLMTSYGFYVPAAPVPCIQPPPVAFISNPPHQNQPNRGPQPRRYSPGGRRYYPIPPSRNLEQQYLPPRNQYQTQSQHNLPPQFHNLPPQFLPMPFPLHPGVMPYSVTPFCHVPPPFPPPGYPTVAPYACPPPYDAVPTAGPPPQLSQQNPAPAPRPAPPFQQLYRSSSERYCNSAVPWYLHQDDVPRFTFTPEPSNLSQHSEPQSYWGQAERSYSPPLWLQSCPALIISPEVDEEKNDNVVASTPESEGLSESDPTPSLEELSQDDEFERDATLSPQPEDQPEDKTDSDGQKQTTNQAHINALKTKLFSLADHRRVQNMLSPGGGQSVRTGLANWSINYGCPGNESRIFSDNCAHLKPLPKELTQLPWHIFGCESLSRIADMLPEETPILLAESDAKACYDPAHVTELKNLRKEDLAALKAHFFDIMKSAMKYASPPGSPLENIEEFLEGCWAYIFLVADPNLLLNLPPPAVMTPPPTTVLPQGSSCRQTSPSDSVMCPPRSVSSTEDGSVGSLPNGDVAATSPPKPHGYNFADLYAASEGSATTVNNFYPEYDNQGPNKSNFCIDDRPTAKPGYPLTKQENPDCTRDLPSGLKALHYVMGLRKEADEKERAPPQDLNQQSNWTTLQLSGGIRFIAPSVFDLTHLTQLHVSHNRLLTLDKDIGKLVNLRVLDISHNCLCYLPSSLSVLPLVELYVQHNGLHCLPNEIGLITTLAVFKAHDNPMAPDLLRFFDTEQPVKSVIAFLRARLDSIPPKLERLPSVLKQDMHPKYPKFSTLCYNILCRHYAASSHYPWCPPWALDWHYRRGLALQEIEAYLADVMAFQEMDGAEYEETFKPRLNALGYSGVFYCKTRARSMGKDHAIVDGCAIFFKSYKFELAEHHGVDISNNPVESANANPLCYFSHTPPINGIRDTPNTIMINRMMPRDNIGLVVTLVPKTAFYIDVRSDLNADRQEKNAIPIVVATTHFHWDPDHCDVKAIQALSFVQCIRAQVMDVVKAKNVRREEVPILVLGDFNSLPGSAVTDYLGRNSVRKNHEEFKEFVNIDLSRFACTADRFNYGHSLNLTNIMERKPLDYTNYTAKFVGTIDHIFVTDESIRPVRTLDPIPISTLKANRIEGFPNPNTPSDHIPIYVEFNLVDPIDVTQSIIARDQEAQVNQRILANEFNTRFASRLGRPVILPNYNPTSGH